MKKAVCHEPFDAKRILVTGATGYIGSLIVAALIKDTRANLIFLIRDTHDFSALLAPVIEEWEAQTRQPWTHDQSKRIQLTRLPHDLANVANLVDELRDVDEVIHCAGCLDCLDAPKLKAVNVLYTAHLVVLARRLPKLKRFVYISSAYSAGYQPHPTSEALLPEPPADPTHYTRTKRQAERLVACSGLPFLVLRPSVLIGDSATGRYSGNRYGLYQQWTGLERLVCDRYHSEFHALAPDLPLHVLHQDAFYNAFSLAHRWLPDGAFMNLVSRPATSPTLRDLWRMWLDVTQPRTVYFYTQWHDIPLQDLPVRQRAYLTFAQVNLRIAAHHWRFETAWIELLRAQGLVFSDATPDTVRVCQDRFTASSELVKKYLQNHAGSLCPHPRVMEIAERPPSALTA